MQAHKNSGMQNHTSRLIHDISTTKWQKSMQMKKLESEFRNVIPMKLNLYLSQNLFLLEFTGTNISKFKRVKDGQMCKKTKYDRR